MVWCARSDGEEGQLILRVESGDERTKADSWQSLLHVSVGWDPYALIDRGECRQRARRSRQRSAPGLPRSSASPCTARSVINRVLPAVVKRRRCSSGAAVWWSQAVGQQGAATLTGRVWLVHLGRLLFICVSSWHPGTHIKHVSIGLHEMQSAQRQQAVCTSGCALAGRIEEPPVTRHQAALPHH